MGKNAGTVAKFGAAGGAAGGAIAGTLMGTTLSTGAKIGVDIAANTVVGAAIDYVATGEVTLEGTAMNATMSGLGGISTYRGLKGAAVPPARLIGESIGDPKMHITKVTDYDAAVAAARQAVDGADLKVAVAGYSAAPEGYELKTATFLNELVGSGDNGKTALITSPTATKGSIDAIATNIAQKHNAPITYLTAEGYVKYINPDEFPTTINTKKFNKIDKYAFQTGAEYSKAGADVSNSLIITGGRDVSVLDFKNAIDANNPVVLLRNNDLGGANFDVNRGRPNNAVAYIEDMIANPTGATNHTKHVDPQWWIDNADKLNRLVKVIDVDSPTAILDAREFLADTQPTNIKIIPEKATLTFETITPQPDNIKHKKVVIDGVEYETKRLYKYNSYDANNPLTASDTYFEVNKNGQKIYLNHKMNVMDDFHCCDRLVGENIYDAFGDYRGNSFLAKSWLDDMYPIINPDEHIRALTRLKEKYGSDEAAINAYINELHKGKTISANDYEATKLTLKQLIKDCK